MGTSAIETVDLSFNYGNQPIIKNISLQVPKGSIYGFLGPNGAGKTTTIKILLNLLKSPADRVFIFGKEINAHRVEILKQIGALVEQPAIYAHLTGRENLINRCLLLGISKSKATEMLSLVGLADAAHKKAGKYSLGMKQRLGIALALVSDPQLLLLDEPTNGLDPNGIIEIRNLLTELAVKHHKTILISSHLLAEVERIATHVGIIHHGELLFQGSIEELHQLSKSSLHIELGQDQIEKAATLLHKAGYEVLEKNATVLVLPFRDKETNGAINALLIQNGLTVTALYQQKKDLENLFLDITKAS